MKNKNLNTVKLRHVCLTVLCGVILSSATAWAEPLPGLTGQYYNDPALSAFALQRIDPTVDFKWQKSSPDPSVDPDTFSVRWTGTIIIPTAGTQEFRMRHNDGVR